MTHTSKIIVPAILASAFATAALAAGSFTEVDVNADGMVTPDEMIAANPEMTEEEFRAADANGDGVLSQEEYEAMSG